MLLSGFCTQSRGRTGTGVNLLVFETSASTDSAIWACFFRNRLQRYYKKCTYANFFKKKCVFYVFLLLCGDFSFANAVFWHGFCCV